MLRFLVVYLLGINLLTVFLFRSDKRRAEAGSRRIPERELLLACLAGGSPGALWAMRRYRHKTRKRRFQLAFVGVLLLQAGLVWWLWQGG